MKRANLLRFGLVALEAFIGLSAIWGGYNLMTGGLVLDQALLINTPFDSYFIPGAILMVVVGGTMVVSALAELFNFRLSDLLSEYAGMILTGWIVIEMLLIGYQNWMQPAFLGLGILTTILAIEKRQFIWRG